jgi:hypothetical protein
LFVILNIMPKRQSKIAEGSVKFITKASPQGMRNTSFCLDIKSVC